MNFKEAIEKLKTIEGTTDFIKVIEQEYESLSTKNYDLVGEIKKNRDKARSYEPVIAALGELGIETPSDEAVKKFAEVYKANTTSLGTLQTQVAELQGKLSAKEREVLLRDAAGKTGANAIALSKLLDVSVPVEISGDKVLVGDKKVELAKYVKENLPEFEPAIFPRNSQLPDAPPSGKEQKHSTVKAVEGYFAEIPEQYKQK